MTNHHHQTADGGPRRRFYRSPSCAHFYKFWPLLAGLLTFATGCQTKNSNAGVFHVWGWDDANDARMHLAAYKHVLVARIDDTHWEDRDPHKKTPYHFKGIIVRTYKGDWRVGEKITFVHYVDAPAPTDKLDNGDSELMYIFTNEHTSSEIGFYTGDFGTYSPEHELALERIFPARRSR